MISDRPGVRSSLQRQNVTVLKFFWEDQSFPNLMEEGKKKMIITDLNELSYTVNDDNTCSVKVTFNMVIGCKSKDYVDANEFMI
jgi:hypothetical protein